MSTPDSAATALPHGDPSDYVEDGQVLIGCSRQGRDLVPECVELKLANRHGLVTGATGTGKTVTLQVLAEGFSAAGVPVFAADIKGDLSGIAIKGEPGPKLVQRAQDIGLTRYGTASFPVSFWDIFGRDGHPVRATVEQMGPLLLSRLLELTEPQEGVLNIAFRWAADERAAGDEKMVIRDLKDLRAVIDEMGRRSSELRSKYGNVATTTVGVIQRRLLVLEQQGADKFFGEPALDILDFIRVAPDGRGVINILSAEKLMNTPRLYATFLLWMLSELFETAARGGRPRQAQARVPVRRGASPLQRCAAAAAGADRARDAPHPVEGRRRLLRDAEPGRRARPRVGTARQPHPARAARLHAEGVEGGACGGADLPRQSGDRHRARDPGAAGR